MFPAYNLFFGTFIHLPRKTTDGNHVLEINRGALWVSTVDGRIKGYNWDIRDEGNLRKMMERENWVGDDGKETASTVKVNVIHAREDRNEFFFPGFIDTHIHAAQYANAGLFGSSTLLDWLKTYTFPLEKSFGNPSPDIIAPHVESHYGQVISRTLAHGTTCASYFTTIHVPATNYLATLCHERGQRAFIGRVCMDRKHFCPDDYRDLSVGESVAATKDTISHIHSLDPKGDIVKPIITPRFAPACTAPALAELGDLAAAYEPPLHIQTHISENTDEVALVKELFPSSTSYADVYDKANLLTPRTILAHGVHLSPVERELIHSRQARISHCPVSNSALGSGICPVRALLDSGITVGLGTDMSGGFSPSILEAVRHACLVSRLLRHTNATTTAQGGETLSVEEGLYLATRGGAAVVDMADDIGGFEVGMFWDAQLIELGTVRHSPVGEDDGDQFGAVNCVDIFDWESWTEKVHKWVWNGDDRNVKMVWVRGELVHVRRDTTREESGSGVLGSWDGGRYFLGLGLGVLGMLSYARWR